MFYHICINIFSMLEFDTILLLMLELTMVQIFLVRGGGDSCSITNNSNSSSRCTESCMFSDRCSGSDMIAAVVVFISIISCTNILFEEMKTTEIKIS